KEQRLRRFQVGRAKRLEIGEEHVRAGLAGLVETSPQQRRLAHIGRTFHENQAVPTGDGRMEGRVGAPDDVKRGLERYPTALGRERAGVKGRRGDGATWARAKPGRRGGEGVLVPGRPVTLSPRSPRRPFCTL